MFILQWKNNFTTWYNSISKLNGGYLLENKNILIGISNSEDDIIFSEHKK